MNIISVINKLIRIAPDLEEDLSALKEMCKKYPKRKELYWKRLINLLNTKQSHPHWASIKSVVVGKNKVKKKHYSFRPPPPNETVIGALPEYISDKVKKYDLIATEIGKMKYECTETTNIELAEKVLRKDADLDIKMRKVWMEIKDLFSLWDPRLITQKLNIRSQNDLLYVTKTPVNNNSNVSVQRMLVTPEDMEKIMRMLGGQDLGPQQS